MGEGDPCRVGRATALKLALGHGKRRTMTRSMRMILLSTKQLRVSSHGDDRYGLG